MSNAIPRGKFWNELVGRVEACDLSRHRASKLEDLAAWLATAWDMAAGEVLCIYVQHPNNRWDRLREASRQGPTAILLLLEGDEHGELDVRVRDTAVQYPSVHLVVALACPEGGTWAMSGLHYRESTVLPPALASEPTPVSPVAFTTTTEFPREEPIPQQRKDTANRLAVALRALGAAGGDRANPHRANATEALTALTGQPSDRFTFKTVSSSKNIKNRIAEGLAKSPNFLVLLCPETLEHRVNEEMERMSTAAGVPLILVLCGEVIRIKVSGPQNELVQRLRAALELDRPTPPERVDERSSEDCRRTTSDWRAWSYEQWNQRLINYCLGAHGQEPGSIERLAATPEELVVVTGGTEDEVDQVAKAFANACLSNIPRGRSFYGFCGSKLGRKLESAVPWTPESPRPPYFFAMLWFTCLIAYGYPNANGGFYDRLSDLIGNTDSLQGLPKLWLEVWEWTYRRQEAGESIRILSLPPPDDFRTVIGESHFLAFPHKHDRRQIARLLVEAHLVGFEPPITPVISRLQAERGRFSKLFQEDLDNFVSRFVDGGRDPRDSPFWRAVRQEALEPSYSDSSGHPRSGATSILGVFDDEGFLPLLGCAKTWSPPPGYCVQPLDSPISNFEYYALAEDGGFEAVQQVMFESIGLLGPGPRALMNQGVLVFQEDQSNEFYLVSGPDVRGADFALVRDNLLDPFTEVFGGAPEPSRIDGWSEVAGCAVKPLDEPQGALKSVVQLHRTMSPPTLRFVGGIRAPGGYLGLEGFLPRLRAPEAIELSVVLNDRKLKCGRIDEDEWSLPSDLLSSLPMRCTVNGRWFFGGGASQTSKRSLHLLRATVDDRFRPLASGYYFIESSRPGQKQIVGGKLIPLGITTDDDASSIDLIDYEPSIRFLGPGHGELSTKRKTGFDWFAVGPKNHPELLVFLGNVERPTPPADRRSPAASDRRHWRVAFSKATEVRVRTPDGSYHDVNDFKKVLALQRRMVRHKPSRDAPTCQATGLDTISIESPHHSEPLDATLMVADALAALSTRRRGLRYRTVQQLFKDLTGVNDHRLHHELIRAWTECGAFDLVRSQSYPSTTLVARRPRFVVVRRGPLLEASLIGLVTRARAAQVRRLAGEHGVVAHEVQPGCPWQPSILRLQSTERVLNNIGIAGELAPLEWLAWTQGDDVPEHLDVDVQHQGLWTDSPPAGLGLAKSWDWEAAEFRPAAPRDEAGVQVEQLAHRDSGSVYVVVVNGSPRLWTYLRNWALLHAHVLAGRAPFVLHRSGRLSTSGCTPVHLPLSLGRLCAVIGEGQSGPKLAPSKRLVEGYCYPFGRQIRDLVAKVIPVSWLKVKKN